MQATLKHTRMINQRYFFNVSCICRRGAGVVGLSASAGDRASLPEWLGTNVRTCVQMMTKAKMRWALHSTKLSPGANHTSAHRCGAAVQRRLYLHHCMLAWQHPSKLASLLYACAVLSLHDMIIPKGMATYAAPTCPSSHCCMPLYLCCTGF
jgi:hypothetical protein